MQSLQIPSAFKFNFIFKVLLCAETLLITNSINVSLIKNDSPMQLNTYDVEYIASHHLPAQTLITTTSEQLYVISLVTVKKSKVNRSNIIAMSLSKVSR